MFNGDRGTASDDGVSIGWAHRERRRMIADVMRGAGARLQRTTGRAARGLLRFGRTLTKRAVRAHRRRLALRELEALDDRMLKDIGLSRSLLPYEIERRLIELDEKGTAPVGAVQDVIADDGVIPAAGEKEKPFRRAASKQEDGCCHGPPLIHWSDNALV